MPILATLPWTSIIMAVLSFVFQKSQGRSTKTALLTGAAVGAGTYFLADPSNPNNLLGFGQGSTSTPAPTTTDGVGTTGSYGIGQTVSSVVDSAGNVLSSWGPVGTAAVVGAAGLAATVKSWWPILAIGAGFLLLRK